MLIEERDQASHELGNDLRVIVKLQRDDSRIGRRRIGDDVGEIAVDRQQDSILILGGRDYALVGRADDLVARVLAEQNPLQALERDTVQRVLEQCGVKAALAARQLGISRVTLWRKLKLR